MDKKGVGFVPQNGTSFLCTAQDEAQAGLMAGILENAGIPYVIRHSGAGPIYGSASIFGVELHVPSSSYAPGKGIAGSIRLTAGGIGRSGSVLTILHNDSINGRLSRPFMLSKNLP
jgi:hypothetical protein